MNYLLEKLIMDLDKEPITYVTDISTEAGKMKLKKQS